MFECLQCAPTVCRHHHALVAPGHRAAQQLEAVVAAKVEVKQQAVIDAALQPVTGRFQIGHCIETRACTGQLAAHAQQALSHQGFVLDDQDAHVSSIRPHQWSPSMPCTKLQPVGLAAARLASM
ncbi:hypothetical protein D3C72_1668670 [compost metagenome]